MTFVALSLLLLVAAFIIPTLSATGNYLIRPHQIVCQGVSIRVPLNWEIVKQNSHFAYIQKRPSILFYPGEEGGLLFVETHATQPPLQFAEASQDEFKRKYPENTRTPFQLNGRLKNCLRVANNPGEGWSTVECWDGERGIDVEFIGDDSNLSEVGGLIQ